MHPPPAKPKQSKVHTAFKAHVARWRGMVDVDAVGTGEVRLKLKRWAFGVLFHVYMEFRFVVVCVFD